MGIPESHNDPMVIPMWSKMINLYEENDFEHKKRLKIRVVLKFDFDYNITFIDFVKMLSLEELYSISQFSTDITYWTIDMNVLD